MKIGLYVLVLCLANLVLTTTCHAEDEKLLLSLDEISIKNFCVYENKLYSEGAWFRTSSSREYECRRIISEEDKSWRLIWAEVKKE